MCRVLAYLGEPISLADVLFETDSSLVRQSYSPRMMETFLNLAGFGMAAWDPRSVACRRSVHLPRDDAAGLRPEPPQPGCQARADLPRRARPRRHRRRARHGLRVQPAPVPASPARGSRWRTTATCASSPACGTTSSSTSGPSWRSSISGTTDSEWIYALVLSQLEDPLRRAGGARARQRRRVRAAPAARGPGAARDRHVVPGEPVPRHGQVAGRDAVLVRLWLVPRRGRPARDRPAVLQPLVHRRRRPTCDG